MLDRAETEQQVRGVSNAKYKSFPTQAAANVWLKENGVSHVSSSTIASSSSFAKTNRENPLAASYSSFADYRTDTPEDAKPKISPGRKKKASSSASSSLVDPIVVYTDGACEGNGQIGSEAGVGVYFGDNDPRNVSEPLEGEKQTNQRAELTVRSVYSPIAMAGTFKKLSSHLFPLQLGEDMSESSVLRPEANYHFTNLLL